LDGGQVAVIKDDIEVVAEEIKAELAAEVEDSGEKVSPEKAAEIIQEAIKTAKDRKAAKVTPVQTDEVEDAEIVDGELVDSKTTYLNAAVVRLNNLLMQLNDFPEPESLIPYLDEAQLNTICTARTWLMRFPVEIPG
jgi:hypothetical protein